MSKKVLSKAQAKKIIAGKMMTAAGRSFLAAAMNIPLRIAADYKGVGRALLSHSPLIPGQEASFDKDVDVSAYIITDDGTSIVRVTKGERVYARPFTISTLVRTKLRVIKQGHYDVNARAAQKSETEIFRKEDQYIFNALSKIADQPDSNSVISISKATLTIDVISDALASLEENSDLAPSAIVMHPTNNKLLRRASKDHYIDYNTSKELLANGKIARLYNANIVNSSAMAKDEIFILCEPEFLGRFVEETPISSVPSDDTESLKVGFNIYEDVGFIFHNPKGIVKLKIV